MEKFKGTKALQPEYEILIYGFDYDARLQRPISVDAEGRLKTA